jgi:hypothetical protein
MVELLLSPGFHTVLVVGSLLFSVLTVRRRTLFWAVFAAGCTIGFCLLRLVAGGTLEELLTAVLLPTVIVLHAQARQERGTPDEF